MHELDRLRRAANARTDGDNGHRLRHFSVAPALDGRPRDAAAVGLGSGSVINSAAKDATALSTLFGVATVLSPAPARNAAMPAIAAAPDFPNEPPTISTWPYMPLLLSRDAAPATAQSRAAW